MSEIKINLQKALRAGYTFFYCQTFEMDRTVSTIIEGVKTVEKGDWKPVLWDFEESKGDPNQVMEMLSDSDPYTAVIAKNYNWFIEFSDVSEKNYEAVQFIQNRFEEFSARESRKALIIVSDVDFNTAIPAPLRKEFITLDFPLPDRAEIKDILQSIVEAASASDKFKKPTKAQTEELIEAALGLTKRGCANAFAYSIIDTGGQLNSQVVAAMRSAEINETSGLTVGNYDVGELLGYDVAKEFIRKAISNPDSRGVLLLGPPGVGKTHLAKWASTISSKIMIEFELANVQGQGLYGQAESEMRNAIAVIKSISNCVLFIDEIEKAIPGKAASNDTTGTRSFSQLLKFLSDSRPQGCFVIATCNDISKLPPEWVRSERFDVIFFADLPSDDEKSAIYNYYAKKYAVDIDGFGVEKMKEWTGAEIKTACRLAKVMDTNVSNASSFVVPIAKTMKDDITYLREWAKGRSIPASRPVTKRVAPRQLDV